MPSTITDNFWSLLDDEAKLAFTRLMVTGYDDACGMIFKSGGQPPALDLVGIDPGAMAKINAATIQVYGAALDTSMDSVWDGIFADLGIQVDTREEEGEEIEDPWPHLHEYEPNPSGMPRLMVMGHGRHGKDTVCEMMEEMYGIRFRSSSFACSEIVICKILTDDEAEREFLDFLPKNMRSRMYKTIKDYREGWSAHFRNVEYLASFETWVYDVRSQYREFWFQAIRWYNWGDPTKLFREIMSEADVYCGIRDPRELNAIVNSGLLDDVIWVDASKRMPPEDVSSIGVQPWHATLHLDNNHGLEELRTAIQQLMWGQYALLPYEHLDK